MLLALGAVLFVATLVVAAVLETVLGPRGWIEVILFGILALLVSAALAGILKAGGKFKTRQGTVTGAAAVFMVVFTALTGARAAITSQQHLRGWISKLPSTDGATATCGSTHVPLSVDGMFYLPIDEACRESGYRVRVAVRGYPAQVHQVARGRASQLEWRDEAPATIIGQVLWSDGRAAEGAEVSLPECLQGVTARAGHDGRFELTDVPEPCRRFPVRADVRPASGSRRKAILAGWNGNELKLGWVVVAVNEVDHRCLVTLDSAPPASRWLATPTGELLPAAGGPTREFLSCLRRCPRPGDDLGAQEIHPAQADEAIATCRDLDVLRRALRYPELAKARVALAAGLAAEGLQNLKTCAALARARALRDEARSILPDAEPVRHLAREIADREPMCRAP